MQILLIDAYDSFIYIIAQYLKSLDVTVDVIRNDKFILSKLEQKNYSGIILGPGPGHPANSGYVSVINYFKSKTPIFGVCLGMQAITLAFGGEIIKAQHLMHGKTSNIIHNNQGCFNGMKNKFLATRYHSLIAKEATFPHNQLNILARSSDDGYIMGLNHKKFNISGVQFHPESIGTQKGILIFKNYLDSLK